MDMYGEKSRSLPQKAVIIGFEVVFIVLSWWLLFHGGGDWAQRHSGIHNAVHGGPRRTMFLLLLAAACAVRSTAFSVLFPSQGALAWLTPGAQIGLLVGTALALIALSLPRQVALAICALLLMLSAALVNLAPDNPYFLHSLQAWPQGHFLNFNGLTRVVSILWPFVAVGYLLSMRAGERDD